VGSLCDQSVLLMGLSFKPDTDDVRESPSLKIAIDLIKKGAKVIAHDPVAIDNFKSVMGDKSSEIEFVKKWSDVLHKVKIIIIVTPWKEYYSLINFNIENKVIFDARSIFINKKIPQVKYLTIGKRL
jgi:UDPglucose 6-dehydrogenase/GDP-mannose 6-dehydrogenase